MLKTAEITPISSDVSYRSVPANLEAEQALLGAILVNNDALAKVRDFLSDDMFYEPVHGRVYDAVIKLVDRGEVADPVRLKPFFAEDPALKDVGGAAYLVRLAASAATIINAFDYGMTVFEMASRRSLIMMGETLVNEVYDADIDVTPDTLLANHENSLSDFHELTSGRIEQGYRPQGAVVASMYEQIRAAKEHGYAGLSTGLAPVDELIGGLMAPDLTILAGRPSMGKTSIASHIAANVASSFTPEGRPVGVLWCSGEMSAEQNNTRLLSRAIRMNEAFPETVPYQDLLRGHASDEEMAIADEHLVAVMGLNIHWMDSGRMTPSSIKARAARARREFAKQGIELGLVVIDYLQLMTVDGPVDKRIDEVRQASNAMRAFCKDDNIAVLAIAQLSRAVEQRANKRPLMSDLKESGDLEQDAANILMVYTAEYYLKHELPPPGHAGFCEAEAALAAARGKMELIAPKVRNGRTGTAHLLADLANNYFEPDPEKHPSHPQHEGPSL